MPPKRLTLIIICATFFLVHFFIATIYEAHGSDIGIYSNYALAWRQAIQENKTIYQTINKVIEYPPLSIAWLSSPVFFINSPGNFSTLENPARIIWTYVFKLNYFIFDLLIFAFIIFYFLKSSKYLQVKKIGLFIYLSSCLILVNFLYERLDFFLAGLILLAFLSLLNNNSPNWLTYLILALAINFKLIPIFLLPIFIIGSLPQSYLEYFSKNIFNVKLWLTLIKKTLIIITLIVLIFLPFYLYDQNHSLDFLKYHHDRALQIESLYSSCLLLGYHFGLPGYLNFDFGALNFVTPGAIFLAKFSVWLIIYALSIIILWLFKLLKNSSTDINSSSNNNQNIAQTYPQTFLKLIIITLLICITLSKVISPQYFLWLIPLLAFLNYQNKKNVLATLFIIITIILTAFIYPYLYSFFIREQTISSDGSVIATNPAFGASLILFSRNILLIISTFLFIKAIPSYKQKHPIILD